MRNKATPADGFNTESGAAARRERATNNNFPACIGETRSDGAESSFMRYGDSASSRPPIAAAYLVLSMLITIAAIGAYLCL